MRAAARGGRRGLAACICCLVAVCSTRAFLSTPGQDVQRRTLAAALATQVLLPLPAQAGDRDRLSMVLGVRRKFLPRILKGYKELDAAKSVTDDFLEEKNLKKFVQALDSYGSIQRLDEAPDKISRKLQADAKEIKQLLVAKDYKNVMASLENYRLDIPGGPGEFGWGDEG
ncbi:unnamed protein product [Effrenium voratum]|nr:unnamed protein product [Effrenium voratum]CAJ1418938.1 unnamed protein product [Effrenium voratum]